MLKIVKEGKKLEDRELDEIYGGAEGQCGDLCGDQCPWGNLNLFKGYYKIRRELREDMIFIF